jgi:hypothetical protein
MPVPGYSAVGFLELLNRHVRPLPPSLRYAELGSFHGLTLWGIAREHRPRGGNRQLLRIQRFRRHCILIQRTYHS